MDGYKVPVLALKAISDNSPKDSTYILSDLGTLVKMHKARKTADTNIYGLSVGRTSALQRLTVV